MSEPTAGKPEDEDLDQPEDENPGVPNPETGVGIGAGEPSTFEPEEAGPTDDPA
jgi:hypothetical protein